MTEATKKKPGRPPQVPMHERPEFKQAVAESAAIVVQALLAKGVTPVPGQPVAESTPQMTELFREMAMSISEISDQGTNRKRVAPEILAKRQSAGDRMFELLGEVADKVKVARETGDEETAAAWLPEYRVVAKINFNERLVEPFRTGADKQPVANEIYWMGPPSDALLPLNAIAKKIFGHYREWLGTTIGVPTQDNRPVWVTAGGMVVKGDAPAKRFVAPPVEFKDELGIKTNGSDPRAKLINVTGTVAEPARANTVAGAMA